MPSEWKDTVDIGIILCQFETGTKLLAISSQIQKAFDKSGKYINDSELDYILSGLEDAAGDNDVELFDECLDELYDWADERKIWLNGTLGEPE